MDCPLCQATMSSRPTRPLGTRVGAFIFGEIPAPLPGPHFLCAKCQVVLLAPTWEHPFIHPPDIDTLEDYRRSCDAHASRLREGKSLLGSGWTEEQQSYLDHLEQSLRILIALTPEERLGHEAPGPERREQLASLTGAALNQVVGVFNRFFSERAIAQHRRQHPTVGPGWWEFPAILVMSLAAGVGAFVFAQGNTVAAALLTALGYYFWCGLLVGLCLMRFHRLFARVAGSWLWLTLFALVLPGLLAAISYWLFHKGIVTAGRESELVTSGAVALFWLVLASSGWVWVTIGVRRASRTVTETLARVPWIELPDDSKSPAGQGSSC